MSAAVLFACILYAKSADLNSDSLSISALAASMSAAVLFACILYAKSADLNSDKQALLAFPASLPHGRKLNWSSTTPVCTSWLGVKCTPDNSRVHTLCLPALGLFGPIPLDTLGKLDAQEVLSLRSNRLTVELPPDVGSIPSLHSLYLQHNNLCGIIPTTLSSSLTFLDLCYNTFDGEIPLSVQNLTGLTAILLQNNSLSGPIPDLRLAKLRHLNVSNNNLSGPISPSFAEIPSQFLLREHFSVWVTIGTLSWNCAFSFTDTTTISAQQTQEEFLEKDQHMCSNCNCCCRRGIVASLGSCTLDMYFQEKEAHGTTLCLPAIQRAYVSSSTPYLFVALNVLVSTACLCHDASSPS